MNAEMAKIATLDPEWVKREHRRELRFWGSLIVAIIAIAGATYAVVVNKEQATQITRIEPKVTKLEQTPCAKDATSTACQKLRAEVEKAAGVDVTCIPFRLAGYLCPRPGSVLAEEQARGGGDALQTGSTGHQHPSSSSKGGGGNGKGGVGKGGSGGGSASPKGGAPPNPEHPGPNEGAKPQQGTLPSTVEATGNAAAEVVEKAGEAVQGTVEGVGDAAGCVVRGSC